MASKDEVRDALLTAIKANAEAASDGQDYSASGAVNFARAAKDLAEAYAWLMSAAQAH